LQIENHKFASGLAYCEYLNEFLDLFTVRRNVRRKTKFL